MTAFLAAGFALAACGRADSPAAPEAPAAERVADVDPATAPAAVAELAPIEGSGVSGTVRLTDLAAPGSGSGSPGVRVVALVSGLGTEDAFHGLHILAAGSCDDLGEEPAHFDPDGAPHGPFDAPSGARHAGDLGNIRSYDGDGRYDRLDPLVALSGPRSAVGHAVVVRAERDDAFSRHGDAGDVLACGVLEGR